MIMKYFIIFNLVILSFSLEESQSLTSSEADLYKALTEIQPPFQQEVCRFSDEIEDKQIHYLKSCGEGFNCGQESYNDGKTSVYQCIPNIYRQKYGETCNYDIECFTNHCDKINKKCTFSEDDDPIEVFDGTKRCGNGLVYVKKGPEGEGCKDKKKYLDYCRYTPENSDEEIILYPIHPFKVCGESGKATKDKNPGLKVGTIFTKFSDINSLDNGKLTESEYACKSGGVSPSKEYEKDELWVCNDIVRIISIDGDKVTYEFAYPKTGDEKIATLTLEEGYFYYDYIKGKYVPYDTDYKSAAKNYFSKIKEYRNDCKDGTHDFYFSPYDCGIKEIHDAFYYTYDNMYLYNKNDANINMVRDYLLNEESIGKRHGVSSSGILKSKLWILVLFSLLTLF